jgi:hypothetical protein
MIFAVADPVVDGKRLENCDVLIWEQVSDNPSRCHEGLLQVFLKGPLYYPTGQWVTFWRLLLQAETWEEMTRIQRQLPESELRGKRVALAPATPDGGPR